MTAFQQFRLWVRRAPLPEKVAATTACLLIIAVLAWLVAPASTRPGQTTATQGSVNGPGTAPTAAASTGGQPGLQSGVGATSGSVSGTSGGSGTQSRSGPGTPATPSAGTGSGTSAATLPGGRGPSGCVSPPGSDQGVSASQVRIAIALINIVGPAANSTFGIPPTSEQQSDYQEVIDSINASGGAACRKLVPVFFTLDPGDSAGLQQGCLDITQAAPFFVIDNGNYADMPALINCYTQHDLPFLEELELPEAQMNQDYPYLFATASTELVYRNAIFALNGRGFFSPANGFGKLGVIYKDCIPALPGELFAWLNQVGVSGAKLVTYDIGCAAAYAPPSAVEQAILKFKEAGVTHVTELEDGVDFSNFTTIAQQQGFHPKYGLADDGVVAITYGAGHPDYQNMANAVAITGYRYGEEHTPGYAPSAGTQRCNAIYAAHGQGPVYQQADGFGGVACDSLWMLRAALDHAPVLQRNALAAGLQAARSVEFSYASGPNDFTGPKVTYGNEFWRTLQFLQSCSCWRVADPTFRPSFT